MTTRPDPIRDEGELAAAFEAETFLLFKHSFRCPISLRAFDEYRAWCADTGGVATAWIDVVAHRPLSLAAAERSGVGHESPQALLLHQGRVVWDASHGAITRESLAEAVAGA